MVREDTLFLFRQALLTWLIVSATAVAAALVFGLLIASLNRGSFLSGLRAVWGYASGSLGDVFGVSPRRVAALTTLSVKESLRQRVLLVFVVFAAVFLFAGWFISPETQEPVKVTISFVMTATSYLLLMAILFLVAWSLPRDIKAKTVHTILTKPVRRSEVVLGRIFGFSIIGTVILAIMGGVSLIYVYRSVPPAQVHAVLLSKTQFPTRDDAIRWVRGHDELSEEDLVEGESDWRFQQTSLGGSAAGSLDTVPWTGAGGEPTPGVDVEMYRAPEATLTARIPLYGSLHFQDRDGSQVPKAANVGYEWDYRSYVEGGTQAAAIWSFENLASNRLKESLPLEFTFEVFRTHKGDLGKGVLAQFVLVNPQTNRRWTDYPFEVSEQRIARRTIPKVVHDLDGNELDVFQDLIHDGKLRVEAHCISPAQYLGMAQADLYVKAADAPFLVNFLKGLAGIWLQMFLVVCVGVAASTFLSGHVAGMTTAALILCGLFAPFLRELATGSVEGGGPLESLIRLWNGQNPMAPLAPTVWVTLSQGIDVLFRNLLWVFTFVVPDLTGYNSSAFVANGFDIPVMGSVSSLGIVALRTFAYAVPTSLIGYFFLKSREIAK